MENKNKDELRPPVVVILGHVDHGKTTLLDFLRKTTVAEKEAGGITQRIGAYQVTTEEGKKITFIDTPGHAAFSGMRERGAKTADIAILVVAASEGVKPQTKEALEYILAQKIPFIVTATKMDLPGASVETVYSSLAKEGVLFEGRGGDVPLLPISAKNGTGIKELLETISLVSELNGIKGDKDASFEGSVIETSKEKSGPLVSLVVKEGTLRVGDEVVSETVETKIRALITDKGQHVKEAYPGDPVQVLGFSDLPSVGSKVWKKKDGGSEIAKTDKKAVTTTVNSDAKVKILLKAANAGSLEAALANIPAGVLVLASGVGEVTESDVFLAKSSGLRIFVFEAKVSGSAAKLAETESVKIESFSIIYKLFERLEEILQKGIEEVVGKAEIIASFPFNGNKVAGVKVLQGRIQKTDTLTLESEGKKMGEVKVSSIRKGKSEVSEVKQGEECGILFFPQLDFKLSDMLISLRKQN